VINDAESPLAWLARRKSRDGRPMIEPVQFQAGERLRLDFTFAQLMPRMTVDWASPLAGGDRNSVGRPIAMADTVVAARPNFEGWTFDSVGKRCKCWVSALAFRFVVLNYLEVRRALS